MHKAAEIREYSAYYIMYTEVGMTRAFFLVCIVTLCLGNDQNWDNCDVPFHVNTPTVNTFAKALYYLAQREEQLKDTFMDKIVVMLYCLNPFEKVDTLY